MLSSSSQNGQWTYEDATIEVKIGDTIYYWILIMVNGGGYQVSNNYAFPSVYPQIDCLDFGFGCFGSTQDRLKELPFEFTFRKQTSLSH